MNLQTSMTLFKLLFLIEQIQVSSACKSGSKPVDVISNDEDVIQYSTPPEDIVYLGIQFYGLPSFNLLHNCPASALPMHGSLKYAVTGVVKGKLLACGGIDSYGPQSTCSKLEEGFWTPQPGMKHKRSAAAASITKDGGMFVTGGKNEEYLDISSTELYKNGEWTEHSNLPVKMAFHCQVTTDSDVIVAGIDRDNPLNFLVYRLENGEWKKLTENTQFHLRVGHSCQFLNNNRLVILGGKHYMHQVDILDLRTLTWSTGPRIPIELNNDFSIVYKDIIYVIGSKTGDVYSLPENLTGEWAAVRKLNQLPVRQMFPAPIVTYRDFC